MHFNHYISSKRQINATFIFLSCFLTAVQYATYFKSTANVIEIIKFSTCTKYVLVVKLSILDWFTNPLTTRSISYLHRIITLAHPNVQPNSPTFRMSPCNRWSIDMHLAAADRWVAGRSLWGPTGVDQFVPSPTSQSSDPHHASPSLHLTCVGCGN